MAYRHVLLGDYFKFEKGLGYKGEFLAEDSDVALIGMDSHEEGGGYKEGSEKFYSGPFKSEHVAEVGDVIFAGTEQGFGLLASPLIVPESEKFNTYLFSGDVLKAIPLKSDEFSVEYLYNIYRVEKYRVKTAYGDTGTTVRRISNENFAEQLVPLPDLSTQLAINEIISLIDQLIANNRSLSKNLELLAQSIFKSWFIDFDPVHAKSRGEKPIGMDDETAALFPDSFEDSELGMIPKGWEVRSLDEINCYLNGLALQKFPPISRDESLPVIKIAQLKSGDTTKADRASSKIKPKYIIEDGDILFSWSATLEVEHWTSGQGALNQHLFKVTGEKVPSWFAYFSTKASLETFRAIASEKATSMGHIQRGHLSDEKYAIPSEEFLRCVSGTFDSLVSQKILSRTQCRSLTFLRESLLPKLVTGELQIPKELLVS